jgi:hypothetical protein
MQNLYLNARPDERFHLQMGPPIPHVTRLGLVKRVTWSNLILPDGSPGHFTSWWVLGNAIHWYRGNVKCDGTRTRMYWAGQLDDGELPHYVPDLTKYVMTTTQKEKTSVRFFTKPGDPVWDNMGGA